MTPLEMAQKAQAEPPTCDKCPEMVKVKNGYYCGVSGKLLLTSFIDLYSCNGERLKFENGKWSKKE